jgi:hypothetical protein
MRTWASSSTRILESAAVIVIKLLFSDRDLHTVLNLIQPEVKPIT